MRQNPIEIGDQNCGRALFVCQGSVIMIADLRIRKRVGRCGSWLLLADFWGVGGLQPRVARPKSTDSCCFQGVVGVTR
jgi:hypothetical protein